MNDTRDVFTYIVITEGDEYYCGKTDDLYIRMKQHLSENSNHWFGRKNRKNIKQVIYFEKDIERKIKSFGVKLFMKTIRGEQRFQ